MAENQTLRIVVLGKTGIGKSSLANTLCGKKGEFKESASVNSETKECCAKTTSINGRNICLIDTPGLFDTDLKSTDLSPDILKCIEECAPGPHAFLLVLKVERYTQQEQEVVDIILKYFSEEALKYTTVVFTHGDQLDEEMKVQDWAYKSKTLKTLIQKCGGRCHVFDNKYWDKDQQDPYRNNQYQVTELLKTIEATLTDMNEKYYTNKFLEFVINNKERWPVFKYLAASVLLAVLLGAEILAKALFERKKQSARPSTGEDPSLYQEEQEMDTLRIVLLGKTGSGKSSLGNTIFGDRGCFDVSHRISGTNRCQSETRRVNGRKVQLVDTPGFRDTDPRITGPGPELFKCLEECAPGPNAFLLVLRVERYTQQEQAVVELILKYFSEEVLKYTTVVFTHGDQLPDEIRVEEWVNHNRFLKLLVQKCGGRCHVFDNRYWNNSQDRYRNNQHQVRELLKTIDQTVRENGGRYYTNELFKYIKSSFISWIRNWLFS